MGYEIVRVTEEARYVDGAVVEYRIVEWKTAKDGPFQERFTKADFNTANVRQKLQQLASDLQSLRS